MIVLTFYAKHLQALKDAGIMNNISDPNATEMRGWVMLMLQRAAENVNPSECNDPAVLLACSLGSDSCPAACQKKADDENGDTEKKDTNRVIAGDLDISVVDYNSSVQSAPKGIFVANTLKFNASEKIQLDSLTLKRTGLGTQKSISKVWLEKNGVAVTNSASVGSDGLAVLNFKSNRDIISEATEYQLVVELASTATAGDEFAFELKSAESTAKNTTISGTTSTYRVSNYNVVALTARVNAYNANVTEYDLGNSADYVIWEFSLESDSKSDDRDIFVKSLTFRNMWTLDFDDTFKNVKVYRDSKIVSKNVEVNGKDVTVSLDEDTIKANRKAVYTVRAEVSSLEDVGKTVQLALQNTRDIIADEQDTNFRTTIAYTGNGATTTSLTLNAYKFKGGKVTFESASNFAKTVNAYNGSSDITVAKWKLVVTEPVELPDITLDIAAKNSAAANSGDRVAAVKRLVLKVGDKRYSADVANGKVVFSDVVVRETADVELLISLNSTIAASVTEIELPDIKWGTATNGTYQNNDATLKGSDIAWLVQTAKVLVKMPKFTLTTSSVSTQETVINDSTSKTLMKGTLEAKENDVNVNAFTVTLGKELKAASASDAPSLEVYLYLNDSVFANGTLNKTATNSWVASYRFNSLWTIKVGEKLPFEIKVVPTIAESQEIYLDVKAQGTDNNGNETETATESSATLKVKGNATIDITNTSSSDRIVDPTNNITIYQGELDVKNWSTVLSKFELTTDFDAAVLNLSNYKLVIDWENVANRATTWATSLVFDSDLSENLQEGKHKVEVKANVDYQSSVNSGTDASKYTYSVSKVSINDWAQTSSTTTKTYFAKGFFALSKVSTSDGSLTIKITNTSDKAVKLTSIGVDNWSNVATASVDNQDVSLTWTDQWEFSERNLAAWSSIEMTMIAKKDQTAKLTSISYTVTDDNKDYKYTVDNKLTAVGSWGQFYSSK